MNIKRINELKLLPLTTFLSAFLLAGCAPSPIDFDVSGDENKDKSDQYAYVLKGQKVTLEWKVTETKDGTDSVSISPSIGAVDLTGSVDIDPVTESTVYTITNQSSVGGKVTPQTAEVTVDALDAYCASSNVDQGLKLSYPTGTPPAAGWPLVVLIHGGGLTRRTLVDMEPYRDELIANNFAVANINYRLLQTSPTDTGDALWPAPIADAKCALRWLHTIPSDIDSNNIGVVGHSGGAHLALLLGLTRQGQEPSFEDVGAYAGQSVNLKTSVVLAGPTNVAHAFNYFRLTNASATLLKEFLYVYGNPLDDDGTNPPKTDTIAQASPDTYIDDTQTDNLTFPLLMLYGDKDTIAPPFAGCHLHDKIKADALSAGVTPNTRFYRIEGGTHESFVKAIETNLVTTGHRIDETLEVLLPYLKWQLQGEADTLPESDTCTTEEYDLMDQVINYTP